jgi:hypothetical protein
MGRGEIASTKKGPGPFFERVCHDSAVEFLNFVLIFTAGYLVLRRPDRERLAFGLLVASSLLMATLFLIGARGSILPGLNY